MNKVGNEGKVVNSWDDLSDIPTDKLIKLRDVATDNVRELGQALEDERMMLIAVLGELASRKDR